jgi:hypothetical protein
VTNTCMARSYFTGNKVDKSGVGKECKARIIEPVYFMSWLSDACRHLITSPRIRQGRQVLLVARKTITVI